jgi:hypothetical protein
MALASMLSVFGFSLFAALSEPNEGAGIAGTELPSKFALAPENALPAAAAAASTSSGGTPIPAPEAGTMTGVEGEKFGIIIARPLAPVSPDGFPVRKNVLVFG